MPSPRARRSMTARWRIQQADTSRYLAAPPPPRLPREAEEAAMAKFIAERGVTRAAPVESELIQARHEPSRPQPMAGWR